MYEELDMNQEMWVFQIAFYLLPIWDTSSRISLTPPVPGCMHEIGGCWQDATDFLACPFLHFNRLVLVATVLTSSNQTYNIALENSWKSTHGPYRSHRVLEESPKKTSVPCCFGAFPFLAPLFSLAQCLDPWPTRRQAERADYCREAVNPPSKLDESPLDREWRSGAGTAGTPLVADIAESRGVLKTGWWFGTFLFSHILGIIIPIDCHIFQKSWNHQPDVYFIYRWTWGNAKFPVFVLPSWNHPKIWCVRLAVCKDNGCNHGYRLRTI